MFNSCPAAQGHTRPGFVTLGRRGYYNFFSMKPFIRNIISLLVFLITSAFFCTASTEAENTAKVYTIQIADDTINPVTAQYIADAIDQAAKAGSECLIVELDTPGGLVSSTRSIVQSIMAAPIPVVVYVAPSGARAGSAGVFITYASHVAAMAPSTNIGAAHPVSIQGESERRSIWDALRDLIDAVNPKAKKEDNKEDQGEGSQKKSSPQEDKALNDTLAFIRSVAQERNRNSEWALKAVAESASITEQEALELKVVEIVASDLNDLVRKLDGRVVNLAGGEKSLKTRDAAIIPIEMTFRQKLLNALANPQIAYILLMLGFYGLLYEVTNPGIGVPGVAGAIFIILAFFSFQMLPTNFAGLALILLGIILFGAEVFLPGFGLPTLGGIICMVLGSLMLFESPQEAFRISLPLALAFSLPTALITLFLVRAVVTAHRRKVFIGVESMVGQVGTAQTEIVPGVEGKIFIHGELWNAVSEQEIKKGEPVQIIEVEGLLLKVQAVKP